MPNLVWVGRAGLADMGEGVPALCGGPLMSALNFWSFFSKEKDNISQQSPKKPKIKKNIIFAATK